MPFDRRGAASGLCAYVVWGLLTINWHQLRHLPAIGLVGQRILWASVILATLASITHRWSGIAVALRTPNVLLRVVVAAMLLSANWLCYVWAVTHNNIVETALGYFMAPLVTVAIGVVVFHERLRSLQIVALALAATAVVVLTIEAGRVPMFALTLAITWGFYGLIKRTIPLHPIESLAAETFVLLPVALVIIAIVESHGKAIHTTASAAQIMMVIGTGAITIVPLLSFAFAAPRVPFTVLGPMQYVVPTINFLLAVGVYHERMPLLRVAGFSFVWLALAVFTIDSVVSGRRRQDAPHETVVVDADPRGQTVGAASPR